MQSGSEDDAIDASITAALRQRNTDAEKAVLKEARIPEAWAVKPAKLAQKNRDARWTLKRAKARAAKADGTKAKIEIAVPIFGYKAHVSIDRRHGFVRCFTVTSAAAHDEAQLANLLDMTNTASEVWDDTAYRSKTNNTNRRR
jgi:IS5 family transposase